MAFGEEDTHGDAGSHGGSILTRKTGPLPNWVWMAVLLLVALVFSLWKRNKGGNANDNTDDTADSTTDDSLTNQTPPPVFILPQNPQPAVNVTINDTDTPSSAPPSGSKPPATNPPPTSKPPARPAPPHYDPVTVAGYTSKNPAWNSTLWGIAKHYGYGSAQDNYKAIINDPRNSGLKKKIGGDSLSAAKKLPKGATVYVRPKGR